MLGRCGIDCVLAPWGGREDMSDVDDLKAAVAKLEGRVNGILKRLLDDIEPRLETLERGGLPPKREFGVKPLKR